MKYYFTFNKEQIPVIKFMLVVSAIFILFSSCRKYTQDIATQEPGSGGPVNTNYSNADTLGKVLQDYTNAGIPGAALALYSETEGWWETTAGYARVEANQLMKVAHLHYLQSVAKTYMAVTILQLKEKGLINLDAKIDSYLPEPYKHYITNAHKISVRHLLNHTSGVAEYTDDIDYSAYILQHPNEKLSTQKLMSYIDGKKSEFEPGSKYRYRNSNYELLAIIADAITGDHAKHISENILQPLQLTQTFCRNDSHYPVYPNLVNSYLDRFSNNSLENVSLMQRTNVSNMIGDDGIIATARDAVGFIKGLFQGQLLSPASMAEMKTWVKDKNGEDRYGMGLYTLKFDGVTTYGHGGSGIGAGCGLYYVPSKGVFIFFATNVGTLVDGPVVDKVMELKDRIMSVIVKN